MSLRDRLAAIRCLVPDPKPFDPALLVVMGGRPGGRPLNRDSPFELAVASAWANQMLASNSGFLACVAVYESITNMDWQHRDGQKVGYSFRAAGDLIAAILGEGDYMDWYCCGTAGRVDPEFAAAMAFTGWSPQEA